MEAGHSTVNPGADGARRTRAGALAVLVHMEVPGEMTNQLSHRFGAGLAARLRSPESGGRVWTLFVALGLLVSAVPTLAAEIVEVRVGKHPTFTRVVFELDRPAGYRIERSDPSVDAAELIVSLEASSIPRSVTKKKSLIEQVDVTRAGISPRNGTMRSIGTCLSCDG